MVKSKKKVHVDFYSLAVKDLLEARELYHVHLSKMKNVIGTAIGLYLIRKVDPDEKNPWKHRARKSSPERRLDNTVVRPWSWPCILVFVEKWKKEEDLNDEPDQVIPRFLYMPDGKKIPTCVVYAPRQRLQEVVPPNLVFAEHLFGGGFPVMCQVQGQSHIATIGCLVSDGHLIYALTNRHVVGVFDPQEKLRIYNYVSGLVTGPLIGEAHSNQIGKKNFADVYREWPGKYAMSTLDAGLIRLDDLTNWTSQIYGIGEIGQVMDFNTSTITLDLIGSSLRAHGGVSGEMNGRILALFYRYKSMGGFDYVSDLLIGSRDSKNTIMTRPGDSGTLWFIESNEKNQRRKGIEKENPRPIALQWGGQRFSDSSGEKIFGFALATFLSTICRELDVDVIRDWNTGFNEYWGNVGHYKIAASSCSIVSIPKLRKLMDSNLSLVSFADNIILTGKIERNGVDNFVPLSDVPDLVWKHPAKKLVELRPSIKRGKEGPNHFTDMDEEGNHQFKGKTLLDLSKDPKNLDIQVWLNFYKSLNKSVNDQGCLPFRVWQIYVEMVRFLNERNVDKFLASAGILAHYIGDACQPLHISKYHDGYIDQRGKGVHSAYEEQMIEHNELLVINGINASLKGNIKLAHIIGGKKAALETIKLMQDTIVTLPPVDIIESFLAHKDEGKNRLEKMFDDLGKRTISCMTRGIICLSSLWESAWIEGSGDHNITANELRKRNEKILSELYFNKQFLESHNLDDADFLS